MNAIAAGEIVAAALGRPAGGLSDEVLDLARGLASGVTAEHARRARAAAERVLAGSEIAELWSESDAEADWRASVDDLIRRLGS